MNKQRVILYFLIVSFLSHLAGCDLNEGAPYTRIKNGHLEIASKTFISQEKKGPRVTLLGVIHIGEKNYYKEIQARLDKADITLYEMIGTKEEMQSIKDELDNNCPELKELLPQTMYAQAAKTLDLRQQLNEIDYNRKHFIHADQTLQQHLYSEQAEGNSICRYLEENRFELKKKAVEQEYESKKLIDEVEQIDVQAARNALALFLVKKIDGKRKNCTDEDKAILFDRNDIAITRLKKYLNKYETNTNIIVFYGAAHMEDLEEWLVNYGYIKNTEEWLQAFSL